MPKSRNQALGDLNMAIGEFFGSLADLFSDAAQKRFWRAGENYYQDAVDLSLDAKAIAISLDSIEFTDQPDSVGDPWSFEVVHTDDGELRKSVDPTEPILPLAHPIQPDGEGGWVYGTPPKGTFDNGSFDDPHGEDSR